MKVNNISNGSIEKQEISKQEQKEIDQKITEFISELKQIAEIEDFGIQEMGELVEKIDFPDAQKLKDIESIQNKLFANSERKEKIFQELHKLQWNS